MTSGSWHDFLSAVTAAHVDAPEHDLELATIADLAADKRAQALRVVEDVFEPRMRRWADKPLVGEALGVWHDVALRTRNQKMLIRRPNNNRPDVHASAMLPKAFFDRLLEALHANVQLEETGAEAETGRVQHAIRKHQSRRALLGKQEFAQAIFEFADSVHFDARHSEGECAQFLYDLLGRVTRHRNNAPLLSTTAAAAAVTSFSSASFDDAFFWLDFEMLDPFPSAIDWLAILDKGDDELFDVMVQRFGRKTSLLSDSEDESHIPPLRVSHSPPEYDLRRTWHHLRRCIVTIQLFCRRNFRMRLRPIAMEASANLSSSAALPPSVGVHEPSASQRSTILREAKEKAKRAYEDEYEEFRRTKQPNRDPFAWPDRSTHNKASKSRSGRHRHAKWVPHHEWRQTSNVTPPAFVGSLDDGGVSVRFEPQTAKPALATPPKPGVPWRFTSRPPTPPQFEADPPPEEPREHRKQDDEKWRALHEKPWKSGTRPPSPTPPPVLAAEPAEPEEDVDPGSTEGAAALAGPWLPSHGGGGHWKSWFDITSFSGQEYKMGISAAPASADAATSTARADAADAGNAADEEEPRWYGPRPGSHWEELIEPGGLNAVGRCYSVHDGVVVHGVAPAAHASTLSHLSSTEIKQVMVK